MRKIIGKKYLEPREIFKSYLKANGFTASSFTEEFNIVEPGALSLSTVQSLMSGRRDFYDMKARTLLQICIFLASCESDDLEYITNTSNRLMISLINGESIPTYE